MPNVFISISSCGLPDRVIVVELTSMMVLVPGSVGGDGGSSGHNDKFRRAT